MNKSESLAYEILTVIGWEPERIIVNTKTGENVGMPDFECNRNRYIEVKVSKDGLKRTQIDKFFHMIMEGKDIYIMIFSEDYTAFTMYKYLFKYIPVDSNSIPELDRLKESGSLPISVNRE